MESRNTLQELAREHGVEHCAVLGERIAGAVVALWREIQSPPRAAWLIIATRSARRRGELTHRFSPRRPM